MSDLPGEMMKASLVAPAASIRSTRCSLTARGRSTAPSKRLPTGNSSLENASGWIRVPAPAAGMMPHIVDTPLEDRFKLRGAPRGGVFVERSFASPPGHQAQLVAIAVERRHRVVGRRRNQHLTPWRKEMLQSRPPVREDRGTARGRLEQAP